MFGHRGFPGFRMAFVKLLHDSELLVNEIGGSSGRGVVPGPNESVQERVGRERCLLLGRSLPTRK